MRADQFWPHQAAREKGGGYRRKAAAFTSSWMGVCLYVAPILFLLVALAQAQTPTPTLPPNTWVKITPMPGGGAGPGGARYWGKNDDCTRTTNTTTPVGRSYGGVAYGDGKIFYFGGGHGSHPGNDMEIYTITDRTWRQQYQPECFPSCCAYVGCWGPTPTGTPSPCPTEVAPECTNPCQGGNSTVVSPLGRPYTEHMVQKYAWNPDRGEMFVGNGTGAWSYAPPDTWQHLNTDIPGRTGVGRTLVFWDQETHAIYAMSSSDYRVMRFDYGTNTWVSLGSVPYATTGIATTTMGEAYMAARKRHLILHNDYRINLTGATEYDALNNYFTSVSVPAAIQSRPPPYELAYDSWHQLIVVWDQVGNTWWTYDVNGTWTQIVPTGAFTNYSGVITWPQHLVFDDLSGRFFGIPITGAGASGQGGIAQDTVQVWNYVLSNDPPLDTPTPRDTNTAGPSPTATKTPTRTLTPTPTRTATPDVRLVPLTVQELLDATTYNVNTTGRARTSEPVTSGVPLKDSDGVTSVAQLAVLDTSLSTYIPAQFRALHYYPSGNIQWVLVDFQTDLAANGSATQYAVAKASGPSGSNLATDGTAITVNTGVAQFSIRKANQNLIDSAVVNGVTLLTAGHSAGLVAADSTTTYVSNNDASSTAVIEENGPLRSVIREEGLVKSAGGTQLFGYTVRLSFYKGKSYVHSEVEIQNAYLTSLTNKVFTYIEARLPLTLGAAPYGSTLSDQSSVQSATLSSAGDIHWLFQGETFHKGSSTGIRFPGSNSSIFQEEGGFGYYACWFGPGQTGYTIQNNSTVQHLFVGTSEYARGYGDLSSLATTAGMSVAMRDFDAYFPSGIEMNGSREAAVEIYSKHNTQTNLIYDWGVHEIRDVLWDFHTDAGDPELTYYRVQYPLFARAPFEQYRATGAILGRTKLYDVAGIGAYHTQNIVGGQNQWQPSNQSQYGLATYNQTNQVGGAMRTYDWSSGGRQNNNDITIPKLLTFLSTGYGGEFQYVWNFMDFVAGIAIHRSDPETGSAGDRTTWPFNQEASVPSTSGNHCNGYSGNKFEGDLEHENVLGLPILYYLTGRESLMRAMMDHGEWFLREYDPATHYSACAISGRGLAQETKWLGVLGEVTGQSRFTTGMETLVRQNYDCATISNPADITNQGQDYDRGYIWDQGATTWHVCADDHNYWCALDCGTPSTWCPATCPGSGLCTYVRLATTGPTVETRIHAWMEAIRLLPSGDVVLRKNLEDRILGVAYWLVQETYNDNGNSSCRGFGCPNFGPYVPLDDPILPENVRTAAFGSSDAMDMLAYGYERTKDPTFLNVGRRIVGSLGAFASPFCGTINVGSQTFAPYGGLQANQFIWDDLHRADWDVTYLNDDPTTQGGLGVTDNGDGTYTLSWLVPNNAVTYRLKYGPQPMVQNLGFDRYTRQYNYPPATYDNFWAVNGQEVTNQPVNIASEPTPQMGGTTQQFTLSAPANSRFALEIDIQNTAETATPTPTPTGPTPTPTPTATRTPTPTATRTPTTASNRPRPVIMHGTPKAG